MVPTDYSFLSTIKDWEVQKEVMRELAKKDLYFLCRYILNYKDLETKTDLHYRLCSELDSDPHRYLYLIFRGSFKTSIGLAKCIQWMIRDPDVEIGIGCDQKERAERRTRDLRDMVERNELLKELFPDTFYKNPDTESPLWRTDEFTIKRSARDSRTGGFGHPTISAFGLFPTPVGSHYDKVYLDDIENEDNQAGDEQIAKLNRQFSLLIPILKPEASLVVSGTIYSETGPNTNLQRRTGWKVYKRPIMTLDGRPTFPSKFSLDVIRQIRADTPDEWTWLGQYMLQGSRRTDKYFYPFIGKTFNRFKLVGSNLVHNVNDVVSLRDCIVYITVDPGGGADATQANSRTDRVGWTVNAIDKQNRWHILEFKKEYMNDPAFIETLYTLYDKHLPYTIGIEKIPHLQPYISLAFRQKNRSLPISELKHKGRKKADRIRSLIPMLDGIYFEENIDTSGINSWYTDMEHGDDDLDSLAYQIDIARAPTPEQVQKRHVQVDEAEEHTVLKSLPPAEQKEWESWLKIQQKTKRSPELNDYEEYEQELEDFFN